MSKSKDMKLTDLLTHEQLDEVERILKENENDLYEASNKLKRYFDSFKQALIDKGGDPGYLAYQIAFKQFKGGDNGDRVVSFDA